MISEHCSMQSNQSGPRQDDDNYKSNIKCLVVSEKKILLLKWSYMLTGILWTTICAKIATGVDIVFLLAATYQSLKKFLRYYWRKSNWNFFMEKYFFISQKKVFWDVSLKK